MVSIYVPRIPNSYKNMEVSQAEEHSIKIIPFHDKAKNYHVNKKQYEARCNQLVYLGVNCDTVPVPSRLTNRQQRK